ncbi:hypothetical protein Taro_016924 [Colocasia esculenta]|uniref:Uncharacterized protein n=1 Tax=Colocasia esculenta TaxID=4460 RepID=A0A843ULR3_COLES|nr:hypothetical protein [Colocasia esculenta]
MGGGTTFGVPGRRGGVWEVASFPVGSGCELQESVAAVAGYACCERGCCFRSCCGWIRPWPAHPSGCVAKADRAYVWCGLHRCRVVLRTLVRCSSEFLSVGSGGGLRYVVVVLAGTFWMALDAFGGGPPQSYPMFVLVVAALSLYRDELSLLPVVFLFIFEFLGCAGGTSCVPVVGWFASPLTPYMLSQMVLCCALEALVTVRRVALSTCGGRSGALCLRASKSRCGCCALEAVGFGADVAYSALFGLRFLACSFWRVSCGESFLFAVLFRSLVQLCCILSGFGACGGTMCSCSSIVISASGTLCVGLYLVAAPLSLWGGYFALSSLGLQYPRFLSLSSRQEALRAAGIGKAMVRESERSRGNAGRSLHNTFFAKVVLVRSALVLVALWEAHGFEASSQVVDAYRGYLSSWVPQAVVMADRRDWGGGGDDP